MKNWTKESYGNHFFSLVELERKEEMDRHIVEIKRLKGHEREKKGRTLLSLRGRNMGRAYGGRAIVKYMKQQIGLPLPENDIKVGDLVIISLGDPLKKGNPTATVIEGTKFSVTVVFDQVPPKWATKKDLRLDLYVNDITYQRMRDAITVFKNNQEINRGLGTILLGGERLSEILEKPMEGTGGKLDKSQHMAARRALSSEDFFLIQGPPGTGKTQTAMEVIWEGVRKHNQVLATADSNTAVDNMVERLVGMGLSVVRIGHPFRVNPMLLEHTLDEQLQGHPHYQQVVMTREKAFELMKSQEGLTHPSPRWSRGLSKEEIIKLAQQKKGSRGVSASTIKEMAQWLNIRQEIDEQFIKAQELEAAIVKELLDHAQVVCTTNVGAGSDFLMGRTFDLLIMDEATQAVEPSALIPLVKCKQVVFIGDHKQLPPTVLSDEGKKRGMTVSLFERLAKAYGNQRMAMLKVQYRMNERIAHFSNQQFYGGNIEAARENIHWTLDIREDILRKVQDKWQDILDPQRPMVFINCNGNGESVKAGGTSILNISEGEMVLELMDVAKRVGVKPDEIGVITPYKAQADWIRNRIKDEGVEVDTVDSFQGREKNMIILSLVRNNAGGDMGFLKDLRRLNVSITRAMKKCIILGNRQTLEQNDVYRELIKYCHP